MNDVVDKIMTEKQNPFDNSCTASFIYGSVIDALATSSAGACTNPLKRVSIVILIS